MSPRNVTVPVKPYDGNRLIIEPVERTSLLDLLATWELLDMDFPERNDEPPDVVEV